MTNITMPTGFKIDQDGKLWLPGDQFFLDAWELARKLKGIHHFDSIFCVARGGFTLGSVVGNAFKKNDIGVIHMKSYTGEQSGTVIVETRFSEEVLAAGGRGLLILDEMVDSGKSMKELRRILPHAHYAVVYAKEHSKHLVDTYLKIVPDIWIVFPWEKSPTEYISP